MAPLPRLATGDDEPRTVLVKVTCRCVVVVGRHHARYHSCLWPMGMHRARSTVAYGMQEVRAAHFSLRLSLRLQLLFIPGLLNVNFCKS